MVNILIIEDNEHFATVLMNNINDKNENIKVCAIAKDGREALEILEIKENIDVILLDLKIPIYSRKRSTK